MLASLPLNMRRVPKLSVASARTGARKSPLQSGSGTLHATPCLQLALFLNFLQRLGRWLNEPGRDGERAGAIVRGVDQHAQAQVVAAA